MRNFSQAGIATLAAVFSLAGATTSMAASAGNITAIEELARYTPGATVESVMHDIHQLAQQHHMTTQQVEVALLEEIRAHVAEAKALDRTREENRSGGNGEVNLGSGRGSGDMFYTDATSYVWNHGHIGTYTSPNYVIEAPGRGKTVREVRANMIKVKKNAHRKLRINVDRQSQKHTAVEFMREQIGKGYKSSLNNRHVNDSEYNCSQLAWAGYMKAGMDLDKDGGFFVAPRDIAYNSEKTHGYDISEG